MPRAISIIAQEHRIFTCSCFLTSSFLTAAHLMNTQWGFTDHKAHKEEFLFPHFYVAPTVFTNEVKRMESRPQHHKLQQARL